MAEKEKLNKEENIKEIKKQIARKLCDDSCSQEEIQNLIDEYLVLISL